MEINGIIRVNMTGAEIEAALLKARDLPTATALQASLDGLQTDIDTRATKQELGDGLATKQDTLEFATDADIEAAFSN